VKILVLDDEDGFRDSLRMLLEDAGFDVLAEASPGRALEVAAQSEFDVILSDIRMPEMDGIEFLQRYQDSGGTAIVIMMSAYGSEEAAIEAMQQGAYDYIPKPFRAEEVKLVLRKAKEREQLRRQVASLSADLSRYRDGEMVAESPGMKRVLDLAGRAAPHSTTLLITGESGTGKELLARSVHAWSSRKEKPFVAVNCGAIPAELIESELFGHVKGSFTGASADKRGLFEEAEGGTILLDEIGDLPLQLQVTLLRVLQEREIRRVGDSRNRKVDVRVLAATARDLESDVKDGSFREDLYYRLNVVRLHLPPLRERREDLPALAASLLRRAASRNGITATLTAPALDAICRAPWPGNVRELENAIERATILSSDGQIKAADLQQSSATPVPLMEEVGGSLDEAVSAAEVAAVRSALASAGGNRDRAAATLGISVRALFYKIKKHGLSD
jgi:two-component system response regulator AtoC